MKLLGEININGKKNNLYVEKKDKIYKYFLDDKFIGAYDPDVMGENLIVFRENTIENELSAQIKDEIVQTIEKSGKEKVIEENDKNLQFNEDVVYSKNTKESNKNIELKKDEEKCKNKNNKRESKNTKNNEEKNENTTKKINVKQTVKMDAMATDMDSIGKRLEKAGKIRGNDKHAKLGIVESDQISNLRDENGNKLKGQSSRYQAVVVTNEKSKDGGQIVKPLDIETDMQEGTNPTKRNYQVNQNKSVKKDDVVTRLKIQGEETLGIENGEYGELNVYHSRNKTIGGKGVEGNHSLDKQLETPNAKNMIGTDSKTLKLSQEYQDGYRSVENSYQEAKQHEKDNGEPCDEIEVDDIDGDINTHSHDHIDSIVEEIMKNGEVNEKFTEREVKEMVNKAYQNKSKDESLEEFKDRVENSIEIDAEHMKGERH
mgnify:CR=1 FL=1